MVRFLLTIFVVANVSQTNLFAQNSCVPKLEVSHGYAKTVEFVYRGCEGIDRVEIFYWTKTKVERDFPQCGEGRTIAKSKKRLIGGEISLSGNKDGGNAYFTACAYDPSGRSLFVTLAKGSIATSK